eukprot:TRINITY_DN31303_c0_g1_i1.p1 TRINITY_DN31303_c0_g1~~TRINITY_DN31303_c0_g1_i1.p1  ORF type:complete len:107 (-),score=6.85 TRINITY_DN31303_c0_g1_i1:527-847(-)
MDSRNETILVNFHILKNNQNRKFIHPLNLKGNLASIPQKEDTSRGATCLEGHPFNKLTTPNIFHHLLLPGINFRLLNKNYSNLLHLDHLLDNGSPIDTTETANIPR